jgi:hypothetical protein
MDATSLKKPAYSADVRMQLSVDGHTLSIGQLAPDFLILRNPTEHPPSEAEIALWIDGRERRWSVYLPEGISAQTPETKIVLSADNWNERE